MSNLNYWIDLFEKYKDNLICLDIELTKFNGDISLVGIYEPKEGLIECSTLIRGKNLTRNELGKFISKNKLIITFNGLNHDIIKINKEFPGIISKGTKIIDLYILAKSINYGASLKTLEYTFGIDRLTMNSEKKGQAVRLWKEYKKGNLDSLKKLIDYNAQDTINLYFLAEKLFDIAKNKK